MPLKPLLINLVISHFLSLPFSLTYFFRRRLSKPKAHAFRNPIKQIQESVFLFPFFLISRIMLGTRHAPFCAQPRSASHLHRYYRCCRWRRGTRKRGHVWKRRVARPPEEQALQANSKKYRQLLRLASFGFQSGCKSENSFVSSTTTLSPTQEDSWSSPMIHCARLE